MDDMTLLEKVDLALSFMNQEVMELRARLVADPSLAQDDRFRDRLEQMGYQAMTLLSAED